MDSSLHGGSILHRKVTSEPDWKDRQTGLHSAYHWRNTWLATLKSLKSLRSYSYLDPRTLKLRANGMLGVELEFLIPKLTQYCFPNQDNDRKVRQQQVGDPRYEMEQI